jgi:hypothetical protein
MADQSKFAHHTAALESVTLHYVTAREVANRWYCFMAGRRHGTNGAILSRR